MNIAIGKIGKVMLFSHKKWGLGGGDPAVSILYTAIADMNPDCTFYILGRSDFGSLTAEEKATLFPRNNVIDCWSEVTREESWVTVEEWIKPEEWDIPRIEAKKNKIKEMPLDFLKKYNVKLDAAIMFAGMVSSVNMENTIKSVRGKGFSKTLAQFQHTAGPVIHVLNVTKVPMFTISEDPRHIKIIARDLFNRERFCLSQINEKLWVNPIRSYEDQSRFKYEIDVRYAETEKIFLLGEQRRDLTTLEKTIPLAIFMNGHGMHGDDGRYPIVKEYVLDQFPDAIIYGRWPNTIHANDSRFLRRRMGDIMDEVVLRTKYTLVASIKPGFVTCKPYEMLNFGIIPFLHPDYDRKNLLGLPEWLTVSGPAEFKEKIEYLEANPDKRDKLMHKLQTYLKEEYFDGRFVNNMVMKHVYEVQGLTWTPSDATTNVALSSFMINDHQKKFRTLRHNAHLKRLREEAEEGDDDGYETEDTVY